MTTTTDPHNSDHEVRDFLLTTVLLEAAVTGAILANLSGRSLEFLSPPGVALVYAQGFVPAVAAMITRWRTAGSLRGLGLGFGRSSQYLAVALIAPVVICLVAYGFAWLAGLAQVSHPRSSSQIAIEVGLALIPFMLLGLGAEIGWRGLMSNRLAERMGLWQVALWTGVAATAADAGVLLFVAGATELPAYGIAFVLAGSIGLSYPLAWLREQAGSIWPAVAVFTAFQIMKVVVLGPMVTYAEDDRWLLADGGVLLALSALAGGITWWLWVRSSRQSPVARKPGQV